MKNKKALPLTIITLGLVSFFTDAASEMIYPLIPIFVASLGSGAIILGVIEGVAESTAALLKLASGVISDALRKRKLLVLIGYGISSLIRPFTGGVSHAWQIVFIRMFDRVGKGIRTAPRDALVAGAVDADMRGRAFGFHRAMDHAGAVLGPIIALLVLALAIIVFQIHDAVTAMRITFAAAIVPGIIAVLTIIFFVKEDAPPDASGKKFSLSLKDVNRNFLTYLGIMVLFTLGNSSDAFLLFRVEEAIHKSGALNGIVHAIPGLKTVIASFGSEQAQAKAVSMLFLPLIWSFFHIIKVVFATPLGALSDRIGRKIVINIGWGIYAAVYLGFSMLDRLNGPAQVIATFILFAVYALFYSFTEGAEKAFVADIVPQDKRGSAFGLFHFAVGLGALPASVLFGLLYSMFGGRIAFAFGALLAFCAMLLLAFLVEEPRKEARQ
ncbi:MAG: MFS transporter [Spirochaetes bacterium]|nr:MFS transporter [Spirochaetota bacterium]